MGNSNEKNESLNGKRGQCGMESKTWSYYLERNVAIL